MRVIGDSNNLTETIRTNMGLNLKSLKIYNKSKNMNIFTKKVLEYQQKKLKEAQNNLQSHITKKEQLKETKSDKEIANEQKMIEIWSKNVEKIKKEINKIKERE
ncbi:MAG: hypothetical protein ACE5R5_07935 [Nitrosarchaeum sp.]